MRTDQPDIEQADILDWSAPIIADCLDLAYRSCLGRNDELVTNFTQMHRRVWVSIVSNDAAKAVQTRSILLSLAKLCQLDARAIEAIDELVLDELNDVIVSRFRGSPSTTRSYNRILLNAASTLAQTRFAAAA